MTEALKSVRIARRRSRTASPSRCASLIVTGELAEGTPLVQRDLAQRLGVSQTPVRLGLDRARARGPRRGRRDGPRVRQPADAARTSRRSTPRGSGSRGSRPASAPPPSALPSSSGCGSPSASSSASAQEQDVDGYLRARWEFHAACYEAVRPPAPRRRGRAPLLAVRALQPHRALDQGAVSPLGRQLPPLLRGVQDRRLQAAQSVIHESMQWAVDLIWDELPSERGEAGRRGRRRHVHRRRPRRRGRADPRREGALHAARLRPGRRRAPCWSLGGADEVVHGTTVATNAVLEQRGARTALVTTAGFRDVLELRRDAHAAPLRHLLEQAAAARRARACGSRSASACSPPGRWSAPLDEDEARAIAAAAPRRRRRVGCGLPAARAPPPRARAAARRDPARGAAGRRRSRSPRRSCASSRSTSARRRRP